MQRTFFTALRRVSFMLLLVACGARSGLFSDEAPATGIVDAGKDATIVPMDASAIDEGGSTLDVTPPSDVTVSRADCPDADSLLIYTITDTYELQSFDPATGAFKLISRIACPTTTDDTPFSMAVDRRGVAYVLFNLSHRIFRVSTLTGACGATSFAPNQNNFQHFGMGFATNAGGPAETLYVAGDQDVRGAGADGLASIDPTNFQLSVISTSTVLSSAELTGTGDGRLFGFYRKGTLSIPSYIGQVDTTNGTILGERTFPTIDQGTAWAFAYWGGDFYMFHAPGKTTRVTRWRPTDDSVTQVATTNLAIVGAGVSTCAPQE